MTKTQTNTKIQATVIEN